LLLTSDHEGLGNVIIEAMYCGLRIVSTDCGEGVHEILRDGDYGSIVPPRDPAALAKAIASRLSVSHDPQQQMAGAQRFQPAFIAQQFLTLLRGEPVERTVR
jgi:glycosyltransferase involved in cell wall biosynthesis